MGIKAAGFSPQGNQGVGTSIQTAELDDLAVTTPKLANDAVNKDKLGILTTKGDSLTYSTEPARLAVGTNDQVLTADSAQGTGMKWATAGGGGNWVLISRQSRGTDGAKLTWTSLDINTDGIYAIVFNIKTTATSPNIGIFINNDTTVSNYQNQRCVFDGTGVTAARQDQNDIALLAANSTNCSGIVYVHRDIEGFVRWNCHASKKETTALVYSIYSGVKDSTVTNVTQIDLNAANMLTGSEAALYKLTDA